MPAAAWAARSGDPVLFLEGASGAQADARRASPPPGRPRLRARPAFGDLRQGARGGAEGGPERGADRRREDPVENAIAFARYASGSFGWDINDPGHGFVIANASRPLDAAAAAPLSASGTWGPLLITEDAARLPAALRGYLLDVKPGYVGDPTRAVYNHVWVIGDQERDLGRLPVAGRRSRRGRADKVRPRDPTGPAARNAGARAGNGHERDEQRQPVSEAERPDRLAADAGSPSRRSAPWPAPPRRTSRSRSATASGA